MNIKWLTGLAAIAFLFLGVIGFDVFLAQQGRMKYETMDEPPPHMKALLAKQQQELSQEKVFEPVRLGQTVVDGRWRQAAASVYKDNQQRDERRQERMSLRTFLQSPAGEHLDKGLALLAKGDKDQARLHIVHALELHQQYDRAIYIVFLKTLLHSYVQDSDTKDQETLDAAVLKYLEMIQRNYGDQEFQSITGNLIEVIQKAMQQR